MNILLLIVLLEYLVYDTIPGIILHFLWDFTGAFVIKEENTEKNKPSASQEDCKMT